MILHLSVVGVLHNLKFNFGFMIIVEHVRTLWDGLIGTLQHFDNVHVLQVNRNYHKEQVKLVAQCSLGFGTGDNVSEQVHQVYTYRSYCDGLHLNVGKPTSIVYFEAMLKLMLIMVLDPNAIGDYHGS